MAIVQDYAGDIKSLDRPIGRTFIIQLDEETADHLLGGVLKAVWLMNHSYPLPPQALGQDHGAPARNRLPHPGNVRLPAGDRGPRAPGALCARLGQIRERIAATHRHALDNVFTERPWRNVKHQDTPSRACLLCELAKLLLGELLRPLDEVPNHLAHQRRRSLPPEEPACHSIR